MREVCVRMMSADDMPDSLAASATPSEITAECATHSTVQQLARYVRKFSHRADSLTAAQVGLRRPPARILYLLSQHGI